VHKIEAMFALPEPGDLVADKYRIVRAIGRGGMGVVLAARHELLHQDVAIKVLLPEVAEHPEAVSRFLNEARASARIRSEHVAAVMDVGLLDSGMAYMVMELLQGNDLEAVLLEGGLFSVEEVAGRMLEALEGVAHAHALGIVHRDLKPSNLFLANRSDGPASIKVLDFGISKAPRPEDDGTATSTHAMLGSPLFMSPEQVRSAKTVDARSDLWSLGVIMYQLLTGKAPFTGNTLGEVLAAILTEPYVRVAEVRPEVPGAFGAIVDRCLERDRDLRYANAAELAIALEPFAGVPTDSVARICRVLGVRRDAPVAPRSIVTTQAVPEWTPPTAGSTMLAPEVLPQAPSPAVAQAVAQVAPEATVEKLLGPSAGPWSGTREAHATSARRWQRMAALGVTLLAAGAGAVTWAMRSHSPSSTPTAASAPATVPSIAAADRVSSTPVVPVVPAVTPEVLAPVPASPGAEAPAASASSSRTASHPPVAALAPSVRPSLASASTAPLRPHAAAAPGASARPPAVDNILLQRN
jgi:serine/threonine-protein kinase